ncbi:MAG: hypothetical protein KJ601_07220, partial [Nanoarchaeota archaeon]|nr:hypothetical protein [Nanoarchaeota archaeon]
MKVFSLARLDWKTYIELNPDLKSAGILSRTKALEHWYNHGQKEGRIMFKKVLFHPFVDSQPICFDWVTYIDYYPDLRYSGVDNRYKAIIHWMSEGKNEGRILFQKRPLHQILMIGKRILSNFCFRKKILLITNSLELEGAPLSLLLLAKGLKDRGWHVEIGSYFDGPLKEMIKLSDIRLNMLNSDISTRLLFKCFDMIYLNTIVNYRLLDLGKQANKKLVWCIRESEKEKYLSDYKKDNVSLGKYFAIPTKVIFVSNETRKAYSELYPDKFTTIHNGIDIKEISRYKTSHSKDILRKRYKLDNDSLIITNVGTLTGRKGQENIVKAAAQMIDFIMKNKIQI